MPFRLVHGTRGRGKDAQILALHGAEAMLLESKSEKAARQRDQEKENSDHA